MHAQVAKFATQQPAHVTALPTAHTHALTMMSIIITHAEPGKTKKKNAIMEIPGKTLRYTNAIQLEI